MCFFMCLSVDIEVMVHLKLHLTTQELPDYYNTHLIGWLSANQIVTFKLVIQTSQMAKKF